MDLNPQEDGVLQFCGTELCGTENKLVAGCRHQFETPPIALIMGPCIVRCRVALPASNLLTHSAGQPLGRHAARGRRWSRWHAVKPLAGHRQVGRPALAPPVVPPLRCLSSTTGNLPLPTAYTCTPHRFQQQFPRHSHPCRPPSKRLRPGPLALVWWPWQPQPFESPGPTVPSGKALPRNPPWHRCQRWAQQPWAQQQSQQHRLTQEQQSKRGRQRRGQGPTHLP